MTTDRNTYFARAQAELDDAGGRFAMLSKATIVSGSTPVPRQPEGSPWSQSLDQLVGPEPPLEFRIDDAPVVGTAAEVERSLDKATLRRRM
jgi:hypothetical protein